MGRASAASRFAMASVETLEQKLQAAADRVGVLMLAMGVSGTLKGQQTQASRGGVASQRDFQGQKR